MEKPPPKVPKKKREGYQPSLKSQTSSIAEIKKLATLGQSELGYQNYK